MNHNNLKYYNKEVTEYRHFKDLGDFIMLRGSQTKTDNSDNIHSLELFHSVGDHLLKDAMPSDYLERIVKHSEFNRYPWNMLLELKKTEQSKVHHPEGNVWNHTLLVVDQAARHRAESKDPFVFMWAALLHDIGKPDTTKIRKGRITAYNHDKVGAHLSKDFLITFSTDNKFIDHVSALVKYHMQVLYVLKDLPYQDIKGMSRDTDIYEVALLGLCDRLGRKGACEIEEEENRKLFISKYMRLRKEKLWQKQE